MTTDTAIYDISCRMLPKEEAPSLLELIREETTDAAIYLQLSRILQSDHRELLHTMYQQEQSHAACLSGIYTLMTGSRPSVQVPPIQVESLEGMLRRCYGREMRCLAQYEKRSRDPEYGRIFAKLVNQEREHCRSILTILSTLQKRR